MSDREQILAAIRGGLKAGSVAWTAAIDEIPALPESSSPVGTEQLIEIFTRNAGVASAGVSRVPDRAAVPRAVADFLQSTGRAPYIRVAGSAANYDWARETQLGADAPATADGDTLVTGCFAAVADAGAVVLASGAEHAAESAFLAGTHIVIADTGQMVASLEDLWRRLRDCYGGRRWPRMLNIILGPSRTADLGVPSRLGAHGPRCVHVIITGTERTGHPR